MLPQVVAGFAGDAFEPSLLVATHVSGKSPQDDLNVGQESRRDHTGGVEPKLAGEICDRDQRGWIDVWPTQDYEMLSTLAACIAATKQSENLIEVLPDRLNRLRQFGHGRLPWLVTHRNG